VDQEGRASFAASRATRQSFSFPNGTVTIDSSVAGLMTSQVLPFDASAQTRRCTACNRIHLEPLLEECEKLTTTRGAENSVPGLEGRDFSHHDGESSVDRLIRRASGADRERNRNPARSRPAQARSVALDV
jgi:hypothetical protein